MFERYTEDARRVLFYARLAASEHGGEAISPEHLILGLLRTVPATVSACLGPAATSESLRERVAARVTGGPKPAKSVEIPFARAVQQILKEAVGHADDLGDPSIRPEHLLLALVEHEGTTASELLREAGVERPTIVRRLRGVSADDEDPSSLSTA